MPFCQNCGTQVSDGAAFCANCGTPVAAASQAAVNQPAVNQPVFQPIAQPVVMVKPKAPGRGFGISSMVLGIIGLIYGFILLINAYDISTEQLPIIFIYSSLPILSLCFAPAAFKRGYRNGVSISGLFMGIIGAAFFLFAFCGVAFG